MVLGIERGGSGDDGCRPTPLLPFSRSAGTCELYTQHLLQQLFLQNQRVTIRDSIRGDVSWNTDTVGDFIIMRSNGMPVYNFCVTIDDALMKITHVIRYFQIAAAVGQDRMC